METSFFQAQEIQITSVYFKNSKDNGELEAYPRQMIMGGQEYDMEFGMRYLIRKGQQLIRLFDMTDGQNQFRLREENDAWTLINMKAAI